MKYLLDTCSLLWFAEDSNEMSSNAYSIIEDAENQIYVSVISFWEISMKSVTGKLSFPLSPAQLEKLMLQEGFIITPLIVDHISVFNNITIIHRDPFDRLLAAIAIDGKFTIISPDPAFDIIGVNRTW